MPTQTQAPNYQVSEIDSIFYFLYGFYPTKEGQSFELLVGAVLKILNSSKRIVWDERARGEYDSNSYQIDVTVYGTDSHIAVEGKDHTKDEAPVGRPELDKLAGSLIEVNHSTGYFFSATGYTRDAIRKAKASAINPRAKRIDLYHLRASSILDRPNRIETFIVRFHLPEMDLNNTGLLPVLSPKEVAELFPGISEKVNLESRIRFQWNKNIITCYVGLFDSEGVKQGYYRFRKTFAEKFLDVVENGNWRIEGTWDVEDGLIEAHGKQLPLLQVNYRVAFNLTTVTDTISAIGSPILLVRSDENTLDKLITDHQLRGVTFHESGEIYFDGSTA